MCLCFQDSRPMWINHSMLTLCPIWFPCTVGSGLVSAGILPFCSPLVTIAFSFDQKKGKHTLFIQVHGKYCLNSSRSIPWSSDRFRFTPDRSLTTTMMVAQTVTQIYPSKTSFGFGEWLFGQKMKEVFWGVHVKISKPCDWWILVGYFSLLWIEKKECDFFWLEFKFCFQRELCEQWPSTHPQSLLRCRCEMWQSDGVRWMRWFWWRPGCYSASQTDRDKLLGEQSLPFFLFLFMAWLVVQGWICRSD